MKLAALFTAIALSLSVSTLAAQQAPVRVPLLIDTDIGSAVDDAFALGLALASPEVELAGVTTVGEAAEDRAWMVCRLLTHAGRSDVPVAFGRGEQPKGPIDWQIQYRRHPAVVWNRTNKPAAQPAVTLLYDQLKARPRELTIVALGPLSNIAQLLREHPDAKPLVKRIVIMGGSLNVGYNGRPPSVAEWNIKQDVAAAKAVFDSGVPLLIVPLDATAGVKLTAEQRQKIFMAGTPLAFQLGALMELCEQPDQPLFDAVALAAAFDERFGTFAERKLTIAEDGQTRVGEGTPNARVMMALRRDEFLAWTIERLLKHGEPAWPAPPGNVSRPIERGGFPSRVHVVEDYETDIERRWWLSGKLETKDLPPGGRRACRAVLTQDFDDRMGNRNTSYRAVVFNPVPGPPMGPNTRLSFRYKLHGTDRLRVQLFSLSNGYHRYLSLTDLPQDTWQVATVDMTQMRRPDGSGGPLATDERIDDIQFYIDPRGELLIDDVVLYDAAAADERRPFPKRIVFTGWFDTGKQGAEWPGEFEIVPHEQPRKWKFARSVASEDGKHRLRVDLRGRRLLPNIVEVAFDYRIAGGDGIGVVLADRRGGETELSMETRARPGGWNHATARFEIPHADTQQYIDEVRLIPPTGQTLEIDNLLIYEPAG